MYYKSITFANNTRSIPTLYVGQTVFLIIKGYPMPAARIITESKLVRTYGTSDDNFDVVQYTLYNARTNDFETEFDFNYGISFFATLDDAMKAIANRNNTKFKNITKFK